MAVMVSRPEKDNNESLNTSTTDSSSLNPQERKALVEGVYRKHWSNICNYVRKHFGEGPPDPEDVAQIAMAKFHNLESPDQVANPKAYLETAARNVVIDYYRKMKRRRPVFVEAYEDEAEEKVYEITPERVLLDEERLKELARLLEKLPEQRRRMILMQRFEGLSCREIGEKFGMSGAAVSKQIERALAQCVSQMRKFEDEK